MIASFLIRLAGLSYQRVFVFGGLLAAIYYFTIFDDGSQLDKRLQTLQGEIAKQENTQRESESALREVEQVRAAVGLLSEQFRLVSAALPGEIQMADVLKTIDGISVATQVNVRAKAPRPPVVLDVVEEMPLQLQMEGSYSQITQFLFYVASLERIMRVRNFTLALSPDARPPFKNEVRLRFEGQIASYRFVGDSPDSKKNAAPKAPVPARPTGGRR